MRTENACTYCYLTEVTLEQVETLFSSPTKLPTTF